MALHLVKLCVGVASAEELREHVSGGVPSQGGGEWLVAHETRSMPARGDEIAGRGSLYWVMRGRIACRQAIVRLDGVTDGRGARRCRIVLSPEVVDVEQRQRKVFQGWRYLDAADAPPDLSAEASAGLAAMPESMRRELAMLGLA